MTIPNIAQISRGRAEHVQFELVQGLRYRRWVTVFEIDSRKMYFVNNVDVSLFAKNYPDPFKTGDELIVLGQENTFSLYTPRERPKDGYYEIKVGRVISTGAMFGSKGFAFIFLGSLASAISAGLLIGLLSAGNVAIWTHFNVLFQAVILFFGGIISARRGFVARANWQAVKSMNLGGDDHGSLTVIAQGVGLRRPAQATAKLPSTRSRMAPRADCLERRAVPVTERYPAWI